MSGAFGGLPSRRLAILWGVLTLALVLRLTGIDWGLPRATPEAAASGIRSSYAFDEDNILEALATTDPPAMRLDPGLYHWGTLHFSLTLAGLEAAQAFGWFGEPWRKSFREMTPGEFERVYVAGRAVSVAVDLATVFVAFLLGWRFFGAEAGLWAAALVAVSPGHVLQAGQIRVDVTAAALVAITVFLTAARAHPALVGAAAGLAVAAKYSACLPVASALVWFAWPRRRELRRVGLIAAGLAIGFLLGEPWVLTQPVEVASQVGRLIALGREIPPAMPPAKPLLLLQSLADMARFSLGAPAFGLAAVGLWGMVKRRELLLPIVVAAGLAALIPQNWPLLRYHLPLVPIAAVAAAGVVVCSGRTRLLGAAAVGWALAISASIVTARLAPHPVNLALSVLHQAAEPGVRVSRIMPEVPPLDSSRYPSGPNPLTGRLDPANLPEWVVTTSLPIIDYPAENLALLDERYQTVAVFRGRGDAGGLTFGDAYAPQDWKYTSPRVSLYRLR